MYGNERDVIILDDEDDAKMHNTTSRTFLTYSWRGADFLIVPLKGCLPAAIKSKTKTDQCQQNSPHSDLKYCSIASVQSVLQNPNVGINVEPPMTTTQLSHDLGRASTGACSLRELSYSGARQSSQLLPQTLAQETPTGYSPTNNLDPAYFANSHWSFAAPAATRPELTTASRPAPISPKTTKLGCRESADTTMAASKSSSKSEGQYLLSQPRVAELADDDDDSIDEENLALWMVQDAEDEMRRSSLENSDFKAETSRRSSTIVPRNLPITSPLVSLDTFRYNGILLAEKVYVELADSDFLRIVHVIQDTSNSAVTLRGWKFRRTRAMNGLIDRKLNEVCWILHIDDDDPRDAKLQGMETVSVCEVVKRRRIRLTNQSFPALSWRDDGKKETPETVENDRVLVCRYTYICVYANAKERVLYKWLEKGCRRLREDECDQRLDNSMKDEELRDIWRGHTVPGGAQEGWLPGEREFLRQEDVSHKGIASRSSLKAPSGPDFPMGDPMKRGSVGSLLTAQDLQQSSDRATKCRSLGQDDHVYTNDPLMSNDNGEEVPIWPMLRSREQRQDRQRSHFNFAGFNGLPIDSSDYDTDENHGMSDLRRGLRQSSIQPRYSRNKSPRIVKMTAQVKTSSSSGTFEKRYEGKITSRYYPTPGLAQRKRSAQMSFSSPMGPMKRVDRGFRAESGKGELRNNSRTLPGIENHSHEESASSGSDRTLGRSQSPDPVEEMYPLSRSKGYISGLLTPDPRRQSSTLRRSRNTTLPLGTGGFSEYPQQLKPFPRTARSSVVNHPQAYGTTEDDGSIIDLTRPQSNPYGSYSSARPSIVLHSGPSKPLYARSVLSSNLGKKSTSREKSPHPTFENPRFKSTSHLRSTEMRQSSHPVFPGSLPVTSGLSQAYRMPSHPVSQATSGPSSRRTEESRQQHLSTITKALTPKANQRRYTFGDCFCGAGGMSRGAVSAGLRINWAFDFNLPACQTYAMNFFGTPIYNIWANDFSEAKGYHKVDICHLSPPCQFFSDAHTIQGKDDDMNTASLFAIFNLLEKAKPRIVTLEQTSGLIRRHPLFFNAVINMFTSRGFSVRWKVMNCADFGLPQRRMRLFIMTSW